MAITWQNVVDIAPELSSVAIGTQNAILADVALQMNDEVWESKLDQGSKYLAAHLATINKRRGSGGPVTSESVGQVARSYAASIAAGAGQLGSTAYGLEYERLIMTLPLARLAIVDG